MLAHQVLEREKTGAQGSSIPRDRTLGTDPQGSGPSLLLSAPPQHHCQLLWKFWSGWKLVGLASPRGRQ